jgi:hypothetical protein
MPSCRATWQVCHVLAEAQRRVRTIEVPADHAIDVPTNKAGYGSYGVLEDVRMSFAVADGRVTDPLGRSTSVEGGAPSG